MIISTFIDIIFFYLLSRLERSKVRVSFFQSSQPQQVSPPDQPLFGFFGDPNNNTYSELNNNLSGVDLLLLYGEGNGDGKMAATTVQQQQPGYDRQLRWDWEMPKMEYRNRLKCRRNDFTWFVIESNVKKVKRIDYE